MAMNRGRTLGRWIARLGPAMLMLFCLWAVAYVIGSYRFRTYTLPNGMIVKREYADWLLTHEYYDIYAPDGVTLRVPNVSTICFDDRYVYALGGWQDDGGIFEGIFSGYDNGRPLSGPEYTSAHRDLYQPSERCNGYFTLNLEPQTFHPYYRHLFLLPCEWRNRRNPSLRNRTWLNWPCEDNSYQLPDGPG
jgi:hypothetical protein